MIARFIFLLFSLLLSQSSFAFCGFYVAKADTSLYNQASQVAMVRNGDKTVLSLMNDYQGELKDFALVVPVPQVLKEGQIHIGDSKLFKHLDDFTAPRLVEYHDEDPCQPTIMYERMAASAPMPSAAPQKMKDAKSLGVTVEAEYTIGEYDIVILSAKESDGLETWLTSNGYKIPKGASAALQPYIKQEMKFFVAKVNLKEQQKTGLKFLRPLQFAFESPKFMLPIRLGMINAKGEQDLILYVLTEKGRVESSNYQTLKLPSDMDIPVYIKNDFANFYKAMFDTQTKKQNLRAVFTEYFWNMGWCDPCAAEPLSFDELKQLGVFWLSGNVNAPNVMGGGVPVQVTRLHVRYTPDSFPEDLNFQETSDTQNFQGRYVLRHAWKGNPDQCPAAKDYFKQLAERHEKEAKTLAELTGWELSDIRKKMDLKDGEKTSGSENDWWKTLWQ
ncbi:hypothetical protein DOJK_01022 [Patescibacteria group bacterium]|nr:hypothetical protein DOJK_01022 [Patescibacteria group bacterium]